MPLCMWVLYVHVCVFMHIWKAKVEVEIILESSSMFIH